MFTKVDSLIARHKDGVYQQMVRACGNYADAEDALAEAILAALSSCDRLQEPEHFRHWLYRVASRCCMRIQMRCRHALGASLEALQGQGLELIDLSPTPGEELDLRETRATIDRAIAALPDKYQTIYMRRVISGESVESVARELGITTAVVKTRLHRARHMLRENLDSQLCHRN